MSNKVVDNFDLRFIMSRSRKSMKLSRTWVKKRIDNGLNEDSKNNLRISTDVKYVLTDQRKISNVTAHLSNSSSFNSTR